MAVWTNFATLMASLASGKAFTDEKAQALAENTLALAECDMTAPVNSPCWHPYDMVIANDGNDGLFYDFAVSGAVASVETPTFVDGWEYRIRFKGLSHNSGTVRDFQLELYRETSAAYGGIYVMSSGVNAAAVLQGYLEFPTVRIDSFYHQFTAFVLSTPAGANDVSIGLAPTNRQNLVTSQKISKARISVSGGTFDGGQMFLDKRRVYL